MWSWAWYQASSAWVLPSSSVHSEWEESGDSRWEKQVRGDRALHVSWSLMALFLVSTNTAHGSGFLIGGGGATELSGSLASF